MPIHPTHVEQPGLAVIEVAAADDTTAWAVQDLLAKHCAIAPADRTIREPGEPGVRRPASGVRRPASGVRRPASGCACSSTCASCPTHSPITRRGSWSPG
ncbi:DUF6207 family protein [Streptomyces sp. LUP30]|uniref:DUF6207 family protein n=1 Tax=Streptomyces sp. LUP30 TaxID=1890285 RepID=UPI00210A40A4|nr:DUF6207 family protein [Streptomyces sp. LUP30]